MTPFVGRERELRALQHGIEQATSGIGGFWLLIGPAGIGKTRLADELAAMARGCDITVLWGRCWEGEGAPAFWPWLQVLRAYTRTLDAATLRGELAGGAGAIAELVEEISALFPDLQPPSALAPEEQRFRLFDSVTTLLTNAVARRPLMIILDDLHWADTASLRLLQFVARELRDAPLLTVAAFRDAELGAAEPAARILNALTRHGERLDLSGLTEAEIGQLIEAHEGTRPEPALLRRLYDQTEGNPFFATEVLRLWQAEGHGTGVATVPPSVRQTLLRRLTRLTSDCQRVLGIAAVAGREFSLGIVESVAERVDAIGGSRASLLPLIDEARAARVLESVSSSADRYRFTHVLMRDTLVDELGSAWRAQLHRQVGAAIEAMYADDLEPHWGELAHHFLDAEPDAAARGIDYAARAAARAVRLHAPETAAVHLQAALRAVDLLRMPERAIAGVSARTPAQLRCDLLVALGEARARAGDIAAAHEVFRLAFELARRLRMPEALARAALGLSGADVRVAVDAHLMDLLEEALAASAGGDSHLRVRLLSRLASALYFSAASERRAALSAEAVAMAERLGDAPALALALGAQRFALWGPDDVAGRLAIAMRIVALSEASGRKDLLLSGHSWRVIDALQSGDIEGADASIRYYAEAAAEMRAPYYLWRASVLRTMRTLLRGDFIEGERLIEQTLAIGQRGRNPNAAMIYGVQLYGLRREQGRLAELEPAIAAFASEQQAIPAFRCGLALLYTQSGRLDAARAIFDELAADDFHALPRDGNWLNAMDELAQVCAALADAKRASVLYALLRPYAGENVVAAFADACEGSVGRYLGLLAATQSHWGLAAEHFEAAIAMNQRLGARPLVAHCQRELGDVLRARGGPGDEERACQLANSAAATYAELGMAYFLSLVRSVPPAEAWAAACAFCREGEMWTIAYAGRTVRLRDAKGFHYLAHLLRHPGRDWHVFDLTSLFRANDGDVGDISGRVPRHLRPTSTGPDARAKTEYGQRLDALRAEIDDAGHCNDGARAAAAQREMDLLTTEIGYAYRLGAARQPNEPLEKARKAVSNRLRAATARIAREHPPLAHHLSVTLRVGTYCSYRPEHPPDWRLD